MLCCPPWCGVPLGSTGTASQTWEALAWSFRFCALLLKQGHLFTWSGLVGWKLQEQKAQSDSQAQPLREAGVAYAPSSS